ncbi:MAG: cell division protein CrgA [Scrofimicrobium sp.]
MAKQSKRDHKPKRDDEELVDNWAKDIPLSPSWWAPVFSTLLILGLVWLVIFYFSGTSYPIPGIGYWNLAIGIGLMLGGFMMTLRWR